MREKQKKFCMEFINCYEHDVSLQFLVKKLLAFHTNLFSFPLHLLYTSVEIKSRVTSVWATVVTMRWLFLFHRAIRYCQLSLYFYLCNQGILSTEKGYTALLSLDPYEKSLIAVILVLTTQIYWSTYNSLISIYYS